MNILIHLQSSGNYMAYVNDDGDWPTGLGRSPDEALGQLVRFIYLTDDCVPSIHDISHEKELEHAH